MHYFLEITAVPIHRDNMPPAAPLAAMVSHLENGQMAELWLHRDQTRTRCFLGLPSRQSMAQARLLLSTGGYTWQEEAPPAIGQTTRLLQRRIRNSYLLESGKAPRQILTPVPLESGSRAVALFAALNQAEKGCGIRLCLKRICQLSLQTVNALHRMEPAEGSLIHQLLYGNECRAFAGCVYGPDDSAELVASEALYAFGGLGMLRVEPQAAQGNLFAACTPSELPAHLKELGSLMLPGEAETLADLSASAGIWGLPLNKDTLFGIPRPLPKVEKGLRLGFRADGSSVDISFRDLTRGMLISAPPGQGKGNQIFSIAYQLHEEGIHFLLIESQKCEQHVLRKLIPDLQVWQPTEGEFIFNPLELPTGVTLGEYRSILLTMLREAFSLDGPLEYLFPDALNRVFARKGFRDDSTAQSAGVTPFGLSEFMEEFSRLMDEQNYSVRTQQDVRTAGLVRLQNLFNQNRAVFDSVCSIPLEQLLNGENLIQLNCLNAESRQIFATLLLIRIGAWFRLRGHHNGDKPVKLAIIVDEAHALLQDTVEADGHRNTFAREYSNMLLTLRSQGIAFITVTQLTDILPRTVADVCETKLFLGSSPYSGLEEYRRVLHADDTTFEHLHLLNPGEGIYCSPRLPSGVYFKAPNVIDSFSLDKAYPRNNRFLQQNPRFAQETFAECSLCPAKGLCNRACKTAARREAEVLVPVMSVLLDTVDPDRQKLARQQLFSRIALQSNDYAQRCCTLVQLVRDYNRTHPGELHAESLMTHAKRLWEPGKGGKKTDGI